MREYVGLARLTETQLPQALAEQLSREFSALHAHDPSFGMAEFNNCIMVRARGGQGVGGGGAAGAHAFPGESWLVFVWRVHAPASVFVLWVCPSC